MEMLETDWWTLELPPEFEASQEDDVVIIEDEDGVGCLEISTLLREDGRVGADELAEFSRELREAGITPQRARIGGWTGNSSSTMTRATTGGSGSSPMVRSSCMQPTSACRTTRAWTMRRSTRSSRRWSRRPEDLLE